MSENLDVIETETKENVIKFAQRYANLLIEQKKIRDDMKALRQEFEELGVPTKIAIKALNQQKKLKKSGQHEIDEVQLYMEWMASSADLDNIIADLIS